MSEAELFAAIPEAAAGRRRARGSPPGMTEPDVMAAMEAFACQNAGTLDGWSASPGAGAYDHEVPPVVARAGRPQRVRHGLHALPA